METLPRATAGIISTAIRAAGAGQASSLPGKVVNRLFPGYLSAHAARLPEGMVVVTGTNGKTTTANMAAAVLRRAGRDFVHNAEGANLFSGIATAFARAPAAPFALLEIDEAIVPPAVTRLRAPRAMVLTNLFRDQLDRYGEVDRLAEGWSHTLAPLRDTVLVANADDPLIAHVALSSGLPTIFFGVEVTDDRAGHEVSDVALCPRCATRLDYTSRWLSQLGDYACGGCDFKRPERDLAAGDIGVSAAGELLTAGLSGRLGTGELRLHVPGVHNVYNALGALALALNLGVDLKTALVALETYRPVFGRWNLLRRGDSTVQVNLSKNPAGMNQTLRSLRESPGDKALIFVLNDHIADGRDVSWIWDVDMEELLPRAQIVVTTGSRRHEMALRLLYAGLDDQRLVTVPSVGAALGLLAERGAHSIYLLPTYTALKEVRGALSDWQAVDT